MHMYEAQLNAARGLVDAFDAHKEMRAKLSAGLATEADEWASFERLREARHGLYDVCAGRA